VIFWPLASALGLKQKDAAFFSVLLLLQAYSVGQRPKNHLALNALMLLEVNVIPACI